MSVIGRQCVGDFMEEGIRDLGARGVRGEMSRDGNQFFSVAALACPHPGVVESKTPSPAGQPVLPHQELGFLPYGIPADLLLSLSLDRQFRVGRSLVVL